MSLSADPLSALTYQRAIETTTETIRSRTRRYRHLVVAVTVVLVGSIAIALITLSWWPLLYIGSIVPLYVIYSISDARILSRWQTEILVLWVERRVDLGPFREALSVVPMMPARTLDGMLTLLPLTTAAGRMESTPIRKIIAFLAREYYVSQQVHAFLTAAARLIALASVISAVVLQSQASLLGLLILPFLSGAAALQRARARRRWRTEIAAAETSGVDRDQVRRHLACVQWTVAAAPFLRRLEDPVATGVER